MRTQILGAQRLPRALLAIPPPLLRPGQLTSLYERVAPLRTDPLWHRRHSRNKSTLLQPAYLNPRRLRR